MNDHVYKVFLHISGICVKLREICLFKPQVILQLCRHVGFVEVLLETQELSSVMISLTLLWDQCSPSWRRQASRVLRAVSAAQAHKTVPALQGQQPHTQAPAQLNASI